MENEEERDHKRKQKKDEEPSPFKWGGDKQGDNKGGPEPNFDWWKKQKFGTRHFILLSVVGFLFAQSLIEYYYEKDTINYVDFAKKYFETDQIKKITVKRVNDGSTYRTVAVVETINDGTKTLVIGSIIF